VPGVDFCADASDHFLQHPDEPCLSRLTPPRSATLGYTCDRLSEVFHERRHTALTWMAVVFGTHRTTQPGSTVSRTCLVSCKSVEFTWM
jgi:hypothetical protein